MLAHAQTDNTGISVWASRAQCGEVRVCVYTCAGCGIRMVTHSSGRLGYGTRPWIGVGTHYTHWRSPDAILCGSIECARRVISCEHSIVISLK